MLLEQPQRLSVLPALRRIMDKIHEGGNIFYDKSRLDAYSIVARIASNIRNAT